MGICKIGERKLIQGKMYRKAKAKDVCIGCSFAGAKTRDSSVTCGCTGSVSWEAIEDGGKECKGTIWVACDAPAKAKLAPKTKWTLVNFREEAGSRATVKKLIDKLDEATVRHNKLGAENARLKNQLAKLKGQK